MELQRWKKTEKSTSLTMFTVMTNNWKRRWPMAIRIRLRVLWLLPSKDRANIYMNELSAAVITNTASSERECCFAQFFGGNSGQTNVNRHCLHVQTMFVDSAGAAAQHPGGL